jgi:peptidoglycan-associated lipoprotein
MFPLLAAVACSGSHKTLAYPTCDSDSDCKAGEHCFNKACAQCAVDNDCPAGQKCNNGACEKAVVAMSCANDAACPPGQSCINGVCKPCSKDSDCGPGGECNNGTCTRAKACKTDDDCPPDKDCINGLCVGDPRPQSQPVNASCQLQPVYFDFDSATIGQDQSANVAADGQCVSGQSAGVTLTGRTDPSGTEEYNLGLSDRRARAVGQSFQALGVDPGRLRILPMGENGTTDSDDDAARSKERRVDVSWE